MKLFENRGRVAGAQWGGLAAVSAVVVTACSVAVGGTPMANDADVAQYRDEITVSVRSVASVVAASRAAATRTAMSTTCNTVNANYNTWADVARRMTTFSQGDWQWPAMIPYVNNTSSASRVFAGQLDAAGRNGDILPGFRLALGAWRNEINSYAADLDADAAARGTGSNTWPRSNPQVDRNNSAKNRALDYC